MSALLRIERLSALRGTTRVLEGVSLEVRAGEIVGLLGANGAGKSTLLRAALGLVPRAAGVVRVEALDPAVADRRALARRVVLLPEHAGVGSELRVLDVVRTGRFAHVGALGAETERDREAVRSALDAVGLAAHGARAFDALSAGERKRVLLARCFAQEAPLFLLDEPTSTLDLGQARVCFRALRTRIGRDGGALVAIHDLALAAAVCDRVIALHEGRVLGEGPPAEVLTPDVVERLFGARAAIEVDTGEVRVRIPR